MNHTKCLFKKVMVSLIFCCTFNASCQAVGLGGIAEFLEEVANDRGALERARQAVNLRRIVEFLEEIASEHETLETAKSCYRLVGAGKGVLNIAELIRTICMMSEDKDTIRSAAIASVVASALLIGVKLFAIYKHKYVFNLETLLYLYPAVSIVRNVCDLVKSIGIARGAQALASRNRQVKSQYPIEALLAFLIVESIASGYEHIAPYVRPNSIGEGITIGLNVFGAKILSFVLWAARQLVEAPHLNATQTVSYGH